MWSKKEKSSAIWTEKSKTIFGNRKATKWKEDLLPDEKKQEERLIWIVRRQKEKNSDFITLVCLV